MHISSSVGGFIYIVETEGVRNADAYIYTLYVAFAPVLEAPLIMHYERTAPRGVV
jgi:hypothetical protein